MKVKGIEIPADVLEQCIARMKLNSRFVTMDMNTIIWNACMDRGLVPRLHRSSNGYRVSAAEVAALGADRIVQREKTAGRIERAGTMGSTPAWRWIAER